MSHHDRQLDIKGRLSLPLEFRPVPGESVYFLKVKVLTIPALRVLSQAAFDRKLREIDGMPDTDVKTRDRVRGAFFGMVVESKVSDQGKLTIPKTLAEGQGLSLPGSARLVGRGELFEIYTPENGVAVGAAEERDLEENAAINNVLGLS